MMNYRHTILSKSLPFFYIIICVFILLNSCKNEATKISVKNPSPYFTNFFSEHEEGILKSISFNSQAGEIKKIEKSKLYESSNDHLFYEFSYPKDSTPFEEYANIHYYFNEANTLDIITADIYLNDSIQEQQLKNNLIDYYTQQFGNPKTDDYGYTTWNASKKEKKTDKEYSYSVAIKKLKDDYGINLEYLKE